MSSKFALQNQIIVSHINGTQDMMPHSLENSLDNQRLSSLFEESRVLVKKGNKLNKEFVRHIIDSPAEINIKEASAKEEAFEEETLRLRA